MNSTIIDNLEDSPRDATGQNSEQVAENDLDPSPQLTIVTESQTKAPDAVGAHDVQLSKKQLKKKRRYEQVMAKKMRKKQEARDAKRAKAIAEGRDLDEEKRIQEERTKSGEGWRRRQELFMDRMKTADSSFRVCIDCAYEDQMTPKEINSLASQIRYCYSTNRKSENPVYLSISSLSGTTRGHLEKVAGFPEQWFARGFDCSDKALTEMHTPNTLVYLTSDSENTLDHLQDDKIYVIGGIVDRNRLQRAAITRADFLGVATAKLPIASYLQLFTTKVLTCNHVFEILLKYREHGNDWKKAMLDVLPARKDIQALDNDKEDGQSQKTDNNKEPSPT